MWLLLACVLIYLACCGLGFWVGFWGVGVGSRLGDGFRQGGYDLSLDVRLFMKQLLFGKG